MMLGTDEDTAAVGASLATRAVRGDVIAISGPLGVGKTTLVRGYLAALGFPDEVPSPSYAIVQPYEALDPPAWHVDLYRIDNASEIAELGLDGADDAVLLVEWPERAAEYLWTHALRLSLHFTESGARRLTAQVPPAWEGRWPPQ